MKVTRESKRQAGYVLLLCAAIAATSCESPTSPTPRTPPAAPEPVPAVVPGPVPPVPPGPPAAILTVEEFVLDGVLAELVPRIRLAESGGLSDALVRSIAFNLADGTPWPHPVTWGVTCRVGAGGSAVITPEKSPYGDPDFNFSVGANYGGKISAVIAFTDDQGRRGTVSAVATLPPR